jgi:predicted N-acetyltransferase YhbS
MSPKKWVISPENPAQSATIECLLDGVLGPERQYRGVYRLRAGGAHNLGMSFTACTGQSLIATIRFWPVPSSHRVCLLGPLAVKPAYQRTGVGAALVMTGLGAALRSHIEKVFVVGHPSYYGRFGFRPARANVGWIPEPVDRTCILVLNIAQPTVSLGAPMQKVWVRGPDDKRLNVLRATNSKRSGQRSVLAQSKAA